MKNEFIKWWNELKEKKYQVAESTDFVLCVYNKSEREEQTLKTPEYIRSLMVTLLIVCFVGGCASFGKFSPQGGQTANAIVSN